MNNQKESLTNYLISSIISDINRGNLEALNILSDNVLDKSHLELLKSKSGDIQIDKLLKLIKDSDKSPLFLYELLPNKLLDNSEITKLLIKRWNNAETFPERFHLLFRITDFDITKEPVANELFKFVIDNYPEFSDRIKFWVSSSNLDPFDYMISRMEDERFPQTKNWLYLFCGSVTENKRTEFAHFIDALNIEKDEMHFMYNETINYIQPMM